MSASRLALRAPRVHALLERHDVLLILSVRFLYGMRIAGPVIIGTSGVPFLRFALLNMMGAAIWAVLVAGAGYYFGVALTAVVADIKRIEAVILVGIPVAGFVVWLWRRRHAASPRVRTLVARCAHRSPPAARPSVRPAQWRRDATEWRTDCRAACQCRRRRKKSRCRISRQRLY